MVRDAGLGESATEGSSLSLSARDPPCILGHRGSHAIYATSIAGTRGFGFSIVTIVSLIISSKPDLCFVGQHHYVQDYDAVTHFGCSTCFLI
jgi:hypothetical protein